MFFQYSKLNILDRDQRLKQKISIVIPQEKTGRYFLLIKNRTKILLYANENSANTFFLSVALKDREVREFMDALCSCRKVYSWEENKKNYLFRQDDRTLATAYIPQSVAKKEWYANINAFRDVAQKLPPALQKQLETGQGVSVGTLPKSMQQNISNVLEAHNQLTNDSGKGGQPGAIVDANDLQNSFIALKNTGQTPEGINLYAFAFSSSNVSATFGYNDYAEQLNKKEKQKQKQNNGTSETEEYNSKEGQLAPKDLENQPVLKAKIKLRLRNVNMVEVMQYLWKYYQVEYISNAETYFYAKKDIDLPEMSLQELMERLCKIYNAVWECRKTGILTVLITPDPVDMNDPEVKRRFEEAIRQYEESHKEPPPAF